MNSWAQKDNRIESVVSFATDRMKNIEQAGFPEFVRQLYENASPDDLINRPVDELYGIALSLWKYGEDREPGTTKLRVFNTTLEEHGWQSSHTVVQIINDDMPFLLDSITFNLLEEGCDLHMLLHPILKIRRNSENARIDRGGKQIVESMMHIEVTAMTDPEQLKALEQKLLQVMNFVTTAIADWKPILGKMQDMIENLDQAPKSVPRSEVEEAQNFMRWLVNDNFTFLGYREYVHGSKKTSADDEPGFGILRDPDVYVLRGPEGLVPVNPEIEHFMDQPQVMLVTKANVKSLVHRVVHLDYIGFKKYDKKGKVIREARFVGLFTSDSYIERARSVPYLGRKVENIITRSGFHEGSHNARSMLHILETLPRDELFQIDEDQLFETAMGILHLHVRPKCRAFIRKDKFERYVSALVFVPREIYDSTLRGKIETILCDAYNGELSSRYAQLSNDRSARWHFIIRTKPGNVPNPDPEDINRRIEEVAQRWNDYLQEVLTERWGEEKGNQLFNKYSRSFNSAYKECFDPRFAVTDVEKLELLPECSNIQFNLFRIAEDPDHIIRLKIYTSHQTIALSDCLPMLENMGLRVIEEMAFDLNVPEKNENVLHVIHDFYLEDVHRRWTDLSEIKDRMEDTLRMVWLGRIDNDGFNKLVLRAGLNWRQVLILRTYSKYLRQLSLSYSQRYMQDTLTQHAEIANNLAELFEVSFRTDLDERTDREAERVRLETRIRDLLEQVDSLDQDRMLRSYLNVISSTLRTNFYQKDVDGQHKSYVSVKINSREIREAPKPKPFAEIFVYSPRVEGVHLRFGPVARGGLRWSDRREDYRTEVLGLVKAQQVKNTVIVPVGAKGGFVPKQLPENGSREEILDEGITCYKIFISGLLDITDNLHVSDVIPPQEVVRRDNDDPYLVVAADKGTATFSDIANGLAQDYGFWLDDAFASGGSQGYDHKKMGITARGAWVSVQRHFREKGINVQTDSISVAGIGDMSGDVFGNGLLCSEAVKLVAAFDHRDIFIDPTPDPAKSYAERARLFDLPRSSWEDYNKDLISKGGGIFSRRAKSISVSREIAKLLDIPADLKNITPNELIRYILKSHVDLLWFGGIGTYVKSSHESNGQVGDRGNDAIRINGHDLNCKVIGEGGNLGCTQLGRIEFALKGGMLNTDAVDNSAGVDCSDNEVNIKILLNSIVSDGHLTRKQRDKLLEDMTDDVGEIVLRDNYLQTQAISVARAASIRELDSFVRYMDDLEKEAHLDRELEFLPGDDELIEREEKDTGLTRPEISVLIAYAKMWLYDELLASDFLNDPYLEKYLKISFPERLGKNYSEAIGNHRLRREIIAKVLCNDIVNRGGIHDIKEETGASPAEIARASIISREVFDLESLWSKIEGLDYMVPATIQILLLMDVEEFARRQTIWFLNNSDPKQPIQEIIKQYQPGIKKLFDMPIVVQTSHEESLKAKIAMYCEQSVSEDLATHISNLEMKVAACDIVQVAHEQKRDVVDVAKAYFMLGDEMGFDWLRDQAEMAETSDHWDRLAVKSVVSDLLDQQKLLTRRTLHESKNRSSLAAAKEWLTESETSTARIQKLIREFQLSGQINVTKLGFAARQIRNVVS
ncbi:NAD-glutamate dehydrogenase [Emcibacter sp.]|uniref:NAD-glutamate dehydrogenase n=1 Tax=Emcibacter sp. TaxID=1979954 RepID=UPI002AA7C095|nr:NAD-glutamate dehydrogenase [Emcibacter sp.]